ncbi:Ribosomal RNA-processing protein 8 [Eumeta japonica]|uniref:Ribosomal RNA-processing protein 8 n=1 Tax=Eumeta variegata TaxID=151549 RepID=A0A4C1TPP6_EUMVA|nr:Ribosomal RNA-processing protein 8 [Eumeta japonica]
MLTSSAKKYLIENKKKKKKNKTSDALLPQGRGPLAPKFLESQDEATTNLNKIKEGKIEKKKNNKKMKPKKLKATLALSKADQEAKIVADDNDMTDDDKHQTATTDSFQAKLKEQLKGGRFRFINEQLYTMNSKKAENLFKQDPQAFEAYHEGYRHQVEKWPLNPLDRITKMIKLPKSLEIGDLDAVKVAKSVPHKVISMDLVSCRDDIIAQIWQKHL